MNEQARPALASSGVETIGKADPDAARGVWLILAVLGLTGFAIVTWLVAMRITIPFDQPLRDAALGWKSLDWAWALISNAANIPLIVIGVGIVAWLLWERRRREAVLVIVTLALVTAGSEAVKQLVARARPPGSGTVVPGVARWRPHHRRERRHGPRPPASLMRRTSTITSGV